ncbi:MAG: hypothetical protein PHY47_16155 [Lachnospiraceae bacterium]|nr:hypothetical protein [Lachnospiraceae bacterium]
MIKRSGLFTADGRKVNLYAFSNQRVSNLKAPGGEWRIAFGTEDFLDEGFYFISNGMDNERILFVRSGSYIEYGRKIYKFDSVHTFSNEYSWKIYEWLDDSFQKISKENERKWEVV